MCVEYVTNVMCCVLSLFYRQKLKSHGQERVNRLNLCHHRHAWDLASLASTIVKGIRREDQTIKLPFNINVLSTYNAITRLTDFIARTYTCLFLITTGIVGGGAMLHTSSHKLVDSS